MAESELEQPRWSVYLERVTRDCAGAPTTVRLIGADDPVVAGAAVTRPLHTIAFEATRDAIELVVGGVGGTAQISYFLDHPSRVLVSEARRTHALVVVDSAGLETLISVGGRQSGSVLGTPARARGCPRTRTTARRSRREPRGCR